ncbi:MAG TPA: DUF485 domain-containing protein [Nitrospiria bacterium]|nr:DUF485 domain-containing protein [Nitrospiria bacterium]
MDSKDVHEALQSKEFKTLVSKRWSISIILTILTLAVYFGFILVLAFNKGLLATKIGDHVTIGIPIGVAVIVISWLFTGIYVRWANKVYDPEVHRISEQFKLKKGKGRA